MRLLLAICLSITFAAPLSAQNYRAPEGVVVSAVADGFAVTDGGGFGARGVWCAAADYAQTELGAGITTEVYIIQPRTSGRGAVIFSTDPAGVVPQQVFITGLSLRQSGARLNVGHALGFCADAQGANR